MPRNTSLTALAAALAIGACSQAPQDEAVDEPLVETIATADLKSPEGTTLGSAALVQDQGGLMISVDVEGISEGPHGFHLHTTGDCSAPDFTSAGGHLNPLDRSHGGENPDGKHLGDLPNLDIGPDGTGSASVELEGASDEVLGYLFDEDGTAVVLHAGPDDYVSDPAGAAGARIACGEFTRG